MPLEDAGKALIEMHEGRVHGRIVLVMTGYAKHWGLWHLTTGLTISHMSL